MSANQGQLPPLTMGKKKHQADPSGDASTESCDENDNVTECRHIAKAVDLSKIRKVIAKSGILSECEMCKDMPPQIDSEMNGYEFDNTLWLCLKCGNQGCGRARNEHALQHFRTPHSDSHAMCVDTTMWSVWCYDCDDMINATVKKKLLEAVDFLKKSAEAKNNAPKFVDNPVMEVVPFVGSTAEDITPRFGFGSFSSDSGLPRPRGLMNLGNTCFFNSVVQCLAQTPYLLNLLNETAEPGQYFRLPGGKIDTPNKTTLELEPLEGHLEKWKQLTNTLADTISELQNGRSETYNPKFLLARLTSRMPQFGGGDQHDSHELLRHLLEAVREEDLRRYQVVILEKLGLKKSCDPSTVEDDKKKIAKFYGQQASEMLLPTEQVFRGVLVSTLQCQDCQHTSHRDEFFLDLSLPISEKQVPPVLRRKAEELEDNSKPSKHQIKKEKRAERKKNKKQKSRHGNAIGMIGPQLPGSGDVDMDKSESESDADVEDNAEASEDVSSKGMESGYNSDKVDHSSPDSNTRISPEMRVDDSGVPSPAIGMLSASHGTPDNSPASSETNIDMGSPLGGGHYSQEEETNEYFDRPESRLSFVTNKNVDLKMGLSKLSLLNDGDNKVNLDAGTSDKMEEEESYDGGACGFDTNKDCEQMGSLAHVYEDTVEKMEEDVEEVEEDADLYTNTISARYQCEEGEYSVQSCLNQFTACELMTGNNKVSCELCTKRHGGVDRKMVYTNATKQLLIYNPPAVLILHLKRFQVYRFRSAKVWKFVKFPTILDLAPFCSKRSQSLPTFEAGQTKVLYSLYGVVEHSGSMHGGHYVAYVKVRPKLDESSYRWQFLPKNQKSDKQPGSPKGAQGSSDPDVPPGKWYYISDSHVAEVSESKVLAAQAYLLFYERIL